MFKTKSLWIVIMILAIGGYWVYKTLLPSPNLTPVENNVSNRATLSKDSDLSNIKENPLKDAYFGDLHIHTKYSFDAYIGGNINSPEDAYKFAKGENINVLGQMVKIDRPLDFAAVTDHSEFIGELYTIQNEDQKGHNAIMARYFRSIGWDTLKQRELFNRIRGAKKTAPSHLPFFNGFESTKSAWTQILTAAEREYVPGKFSTLAAYEWSLIEGDAHLHRNIIFKDMMVPDYPISALEDGTPHELWEGLEEMSQKGASVIAIPHNTNLSNGTVFSEVSKEDAVLRNKFETLIEVHQAKGNSEVSKAFWKNDEFADMDNYSFIEDEKNYVRWALKEGLRVEANTGVNPHKFGMIGSTDTHNATGGNTMESSEYIGNHSFVDLTAKQRSTREWVYSGRVYDVLNPGGLVGVWAPRNTRADIWNALKNREAYATSGSRIKVRFFGGDHFTSLPETYEELVEYGYANGVPMGGDLKIAKDAKPSFIIWTMCDPENVRLDRIQIIKGWYDGSELQEKIFNVAASDGRLNETTGEVIPIGEVVDMNTGLSDPTKGAVELKTLWTDDEFNAKQNAFYYVRVIEIPSARWTLWDKIRQGVSYPAHVPLTVQDRAWSSPIWFTPE